MDSRISLAMANKLRMLFEREDKFLTYPLGIGFDYRYLSFMQDPAVTGLTLQEQLNDKGDFARLMNLIPHDSATYSPDADRPLWTAVKSVLIGADYATSGLTAAEARQLDEAIAFLTDEVVQGGSKVLVYSAAVRRYYHCKTIYDAADKTYLDEKVTVESTTGPAGDRLKAQWAQYREKQFRSARDKAMQDWMALGFKAEVENKQAIQRQLEPKKYLQLGGESYLNDIELSELVDVTGNPISVCTTFFSPYDVFNKTTTWTKITLTKAEVDTLVLGAPADLKALFGAGGGADDGIVAITLEYNDVPIMRPWFHPEFFESRSWRLADNSVVSDGAVPRRGLIPAYITSILAVRNLVITRKKAMAQRPIMIPIIATKALGDIKFSPAPTLDTAKLRSERLAPETRFAITETRAASRRAGSAPVNSRRPITAMPTAAATMPRTVPDRVTGLDSLAPAQRNAYVAIKYDRTTIATPPIWIPPKQDLPPADTGELVTEPYDLPGVAVIAYICKRVPKAPNPDTALSWPG